MCFRQSFCLFCIIPQLIFSMIDYLVFRCCYKLEHQVFLDLHNVFSYYNKDTWRNKNMVINKRNIVFHFTHSYVTSLCQHIANANWKILKSLWHVIADILSTPELQRLHEIIKNFTYNEKYNPKKTYWITLQIVITNWLIKLKI